MAPRKVIPAAKDRYADLFDENGVCKSSKQLANRDQDFIDAMSKATLDASTGKTFFDGEVAGAPLVKSRSRAAAELREGAERAGFSKAVNMFNGGSSSYSGATALMKEWSLTNPVPTGLVPYDLEAPAKMLVPRPTPLRNTIPRLRGQGTARRVKVITGWTGSGTGGITTTQPGISESTTNTGPGGLAYIRPPYISYAGEDLTFNYVSWGLSDSVSWQAEFQGTGFEDIRSLSNTALLYSQMLLDERLILFGRGTSANGYTGALGTPGSITVSAVSASVAPGLPAGFSGNANVFVLVAADAGDLLGTNGYTMHQGPTTTVNSSASVAVTAGQAVQVKIGTDVAGALGYNLYAASVVGGPYYYAGRTGYNVGYVASQPSGGPSTTSGAGDQSAVATNFDGLLTNVAASGGYSTRLNAPFSTSNPGTEFQSAFANLYEAVKADPEEIWLNGFDRMQLSNAILNSANVNAYRVFIQNDALGNVKAGAVVQSLLNEVTGSEVNIKVNPWMPQGNALVRQVTLPIPDSNVSETSYFAMPQDYLAIQWPAVQFTYDASCLEIGSLINVAPAWSAVISGIQGVGVGVQPPSYGDA